MKEKRRARHGTAVGKVSAVRKLSKTEKRPSTMFAGILSAGERVIVFEEAAKIACGEKSIDETDFRIRKFVEQALDRMGS